MKYYNFSYGENEIVKKNYDREISRKKKEENENWKRTK